MKQSILAAYTGLFITFAMAFLGAELDERHARAMAAMAPPVQTMPSATPLPVEAKAPLLSAAPEPAPESIVVKQGDEEISMPLEEYILCVLAAEMPADFHPQALKAQAVAARTYTLYSLRTQKHGDSAVCTDFGCCQAFKSEQDMQAQWGGSYDTYRAKLRQAVADSAGQYLIYEGEPVFAAFHSSSAGYTESSGAIWSALPYLVSVESPESADTVPGYVSQLELSALDFRDTLLHACPEADFSGEESGWIGEASYEDSGRVESMLLGGVMYPGTALRELFSLRSTAFSLEYTGESFLFTVTGFGHGVGMSQYGAQLMATEGSDYAAILAHYYPGTVLVG